MRSAPALLLLTATVFVPMPGIAQTPTLTQGPGDSAVLGCFAPPAVAADLEDPNLVRVACVSFPVGVFPIRIGPGAPITAPPVPPAFLLPADLNGAEPDPPGNPSIDDVWLERPDLAWVTTSGHETVVPFNPRSGEAIAVRFEGVPRLSVPTQRSISGAYVRSDGAPVGGFTTNFTSGVARVGSRLLVTTSNFAVLGASPVNNPGTVLIFDVDEPTPGELVVTVSDPAFLLTSDPNPTHLTPLPGGLVAVTNTGVLRLTSPPSPGGPASIDIVDPAAGAILLSVPLGLSSPAFRAIAVDPTGSVGVVGSGSFRALYAFDLRDLGALPLPAVDATLQRTSCNEDPTGPEGVPCAPQRVIRGVDDPILIPASGLAPPGNDGFVPETRFGAAGDFVVATAHDDGLLAVVPFDARDLGTPHPLLPSRFGSAWVFQVTPPVGTFGEEVGPGPFVLRASSDGALADTLSVWLTQGPDGAIMRGTLGGGLPVPTGDGDGDGTEDVLDTCPFEPNPAQLDSGRVGDTLADGIGDACQCGDVNADGAVLLNDATLIKRAVLGLPPGLAAPLRCNVIGEPDAADADADGLPDDCAINDATVVKRALLGLGPGVGQHCTPALP